ncbi:carbohydrate ABC transporter permease [Clostridium sp.]|uniref:carbohydrate ABC transporter permease n=1 Tax=Clostridium sp. TaxID=1506 RepID=UPI00290DD0A0|nr:carbohydrate ABC transporter permease [Clostridium sp.]MDU5106934.1 carbohydrate ABC transporter permease [Clostridium sp.]
MNIEVTDIKIKNKYKKNKIKRREINKKNIFIYAFLIAISIIMIWPFFQMISTSLMTFQEATSMPPALIPRKASLDAYKNVFNMIPFGKFYLNSIIVCIIRVIGTVLIASFAGYAFAMYEFKGKKLLFSIVLVIMMVPGQIFLLPQFNMMNNLGLLDTLTAIWLPNLFTAYGIFMMRQFYLSIPQALIDAASIDGAGHFRIFFQIATPVIKGAVTVFGIQTAIWSWNDLLWPLIVNSSQDKLTLPIAMSLMKGQYVTDFPSMMAAAMMAVIPMILLYIVFQRSFENMDISSSIK